MASLFSPSSIAPEVPFEFPNAELSPELFTCPCSKQYKSYAAIYTHVKNKHQSEPTFRDNIKRPSWVKTQKGRPKKFSQTEVQFEEKIMEICEMGLLSVCEKLKRKTSLKLVLHGDAEHCESKIRAKFEEINNSSGLPLENCIISVASPHKFYEFYNEFNKHMTEDMASRLLWTLNYNLSLQENYITSSEEPKSIMALKEIWFGCEGVDKEIMKIYDQWNKVVEESHPRTA